ncbi:MAG: c-type cytochrome [Myxococcota bacterium]
MLSTRLLSITLITLLIGCGKEADDSGTVEDFESSVNGAEVYSTSCAGCHSADGTGATGPSLVEKVPQLSDEDLLDVIENGTGSMPDMGLSTPEADAVFLYVRGEFGEFGGA